MRRWWLRYRARAGSCGALSFDDQAISAFARHARLTIRTSALRPSATAVRRRLYGHHLAKQNLRLRLACARLLIVPFEIRRSFNSYNIGILFYPFIYYVLPIPYFVFLILYPVVFLILYPFFIHEFRYGTQKGVRSYRYSPNLQRTFCCRFRQIPGIAKELNQHRSYTPFKFICEVTKGPC